jgi:hypothetical protein
MSEIQGGHGEKFSRKGEEFIGALLSEPTIQAAAKRVKISPATAARWLNDPGFKERYRAARRESMQRTTARLQSASLVAVEALVRIAEVGESESARVTAARTILEAAYRGVEFDDVLVRIERLEVVQSKHRK